MYKVVNYTIDRMYCESELNGNPDKGVEQGLELLQQYFNDSTYSLEDVDEEYENTILHWIADQGLYEFYDIVKQHKDFDKIKNKVNKFNMTPYDLACFSPKMFQSMISLQSGNPMTMIPALLTVNSPRFKLIGTLANKMEKDGLLLQRSIDENIILYFEEHGKTNPTLANLAITLKQQLNDNNAIKEQLNDSVQQDTHISNSQYNTIKQKMLTYKYYLISGFVLLSSYVIMRYWL